MKGARRTFLLLDSKQYRGRQETQGNREKGLLYSITYTHLVIGTPLTLLLAHNTFPTVINSKNKAISCLAVMIIDNKCHTVQESSEGHSCCSLW